MDNSEKESEKFSGIIYIITNTVNDKVYIGQTTRTIIDRFYKHCHFRRDRFSAISNAITKHGKDKFTISEIEHCDSIEHMNEREKYWIIYYNSLTPNGYNIQNGGNGKGKHSQDAIKRIRAASTGRRHTVESLLKMSKAQLGKKLSDETKAKMSKRMAGNKYAEGTIYTDEMREIRRLIISKLPSRGEINYKGVYWSKIECKYGCKFEYNAAEIWCGWYDDAKNAGIVFDIMTILKGHSEAYRNFPGKTLEELKSELSEQPSEKVCNLIDIEFEKRKRQAGLLLENLEGKKFGKLKVISNSSLKFTGGKDRSYCMTICDCGNVVEALNESLKAGAKTHCGCVKKFDNLKGNRYGKLLVIEDSYSEKRPSRKYPVVLSRCQCDCGNIKIIENGALRNNRAKSCGCGMNLSRKKKVD